MTLNHARWLLWTGTLLALVGGGCFGGSKHRVSEAHTAKVLGAVATAEQDLGAAQQLMKEERQVDALRAVLKRLKALDTQLYDEYRLKSLAYEDGDLPTVRQHAMLIVELEKAETALLLYLNEPLAHILEDILMKHPDPRAREEALDIIAGSANEVFTRFKGGYRTDIVDNLRVRARGESNLALRSKMQRIIETLER